MGAVRPERKAGYQRTWRRRRDARIREEFGGYCGANAPPGVGCGANGTSRLERAHLIPTGLSGMERKDRAAADVRENALAYCLLCPPCHRAFDRSGAHP